MSDPADSVGPSDHLLGGPAGEGKQHDAARVDARSEQISDMIGEGLSLARPGSGDNENRTLACRRCCLLLWIQIIQPRKFKWNAIVGFGHIDSLAESAGRWQEIVPDNCSLTQGWG